MRASVLCLLVAACSGGHIAGNGDDGGPSSAAIVGARFDGLPATLEVGGVAQVHAVYLYDDQTTGDVKSVAVHSTAPSVASVDGNLAVHALSEGQTHLVADVDHGAYTLDALLTVKRPGSQVTVRIEVAPSPLTLAPGFGAQLQANGTQADGSQKSLTAQAAWSSSDAGTCSVGATGLVTGVAPGTCTVSATFQGVIGTAQITVSALTVTALRLAPAAATVPKGASLQLTATATLSDGSAQDATQSAAYTSSDATLASVSAGRVQGVGVGTATITASLGGQSASTAVTVEAAALVSISIFPPSLQLALGLSQPCRATALFADGATADVTGSATWTSDTPAIASVSGPLVTAVAKGRTQVHAAIGNVSGSALVSVADATLVSLQLLPSSLSLPLGTSARLRALGTYSDRSLRDVTPDAAWSVADPGVATVDPRGLVTGLAKGQTSVTATLSGKTVSAAVAVTDATLVSLLVFPSAAILPKGDTVRLSLGGAYSDNTVRDVAELATWSSSAPGIASVSNDAGSRGLVTALAEGTTQVTASIGSVTSNASAVSVTAATLTSLRLQPAQYLLPQYLTAPLRLFARYSDGSEFDETASATFTSANASVASVVSSGQGAGLVTAVSRGQTTVTGSLGGLSLGATINVVDAALQSVTVVALRDQLKVGDAQQLRCLALYQGARQPTDVTPLCAWTVSDTLLARLDPRTPGLIVAVAPGSVTAFAELQGVSGSHALQISSAALSRIDVLEASFTLPIGLTRTLIAKATYADGSVADVTFGAEWASAQGGVALVGNTGYLKGIVSGVKPGTANIVATVGAISGTSVATIDDAKPVSISIAPVNPVVNSGGGTFRPSTVQFSATAHFDDGHDYDVTGLATWLSSDSTVAALSNALGTKGRADILGLGISTVTAKYSALQSSTTLTSR